VHGTRALAAIAPHRAAPRFPLLLLAVTLATLGSTGCGSDHASFRSSPEASPGGQRLTLDDIFANVIPEIFDRTWEEFEVGGVPPEVDSRFTRFFHSFRGGKMWAYCNRNLPDPCECDCTEGVDPCLDPASQTILREGRQTMQLFLPHVTDFSEPPYMYVDKGGSHDGEAIQGKIRVAKVLARRGVVAAIWTEEDLFPFGDDEPLPRIAEQFGFNGPARFQREGCKHWLRTRDPLNLTAADLRIDDRYHNAQSYVLCVTFFRRLVEEHFAGDPEAIAWADSVRVLYAGGSKAAGGALSAAGIDPRAVALRTSGFLEFDTGPRAAAHRFETDWRECPLDCPEDDTCTPQLDEQHAWYRYTNWLRRNQDNLPSYWDTYRMGRNRSRYEHLLLLEIAGTHDWINPLGSDEAFWASVDGLVDGVPDPAEERWNFRLVRRINGDHGTSQTVGRTGGGRDVRGDQLLLFRALMHFARGKALPRIEGASLDVSGDPAIDPWTVRVRVTDLPSDHDPLVEEQFKLYVAVSDDRDFRRCTPPIRCREEGVPCTENGVCRDPDWDDNVEEEDKFLKIAPADITVTVDGELRDLVFDPPAEVLAFPEPLVAVIAEVRIDDRVPFNIKDDWVLHTEVMFANEELYPPYSCCPQ